MQPRILLTGFRPFGSLAINPTEELMHALEGFPDADVETVVLDTDYALCEEQFRATVARFAPHAVLSFGVAASSDALRLERIAVNLDDAGIPDSGGHLRNGTPIVEGGPVGYQATWPIDVAYQALVEAGFPARYSNHAGTYVCNHLLYYGLHLLHSLGLETPMGFVHVPPLPEQVGEVEGRTGMALERLAEAAWVCVGVMTRDLVCRYVG